MEINEVKATRALNPTSIDLGEYVINPYRGCVFSCLYCYVRHNKVNSGNRRKWGTYLDVKVNLPDFLKDELKSKRPQRVLLGSTTECYNPYEEKYGLTGKVIAILSEEGIFYSILTRSPGITRDIEILKKGFCESIYFTVNDLPERLAGILEPGSPDMGSRLSAIDSLHAEGLNVVPYFSPALPGISRFEEVLEKFSGLKRIDFEGLNFISGNIGRIIEAISSLYPEKGRLYRKMREDRNIYEKEWERLRKKIQEAAAFFKKDHNIYIHDYGSYFENRYLR